MTQIATDKILSEKEYILDATINERTGAYRQLAALCRDLKDALVEVHARWETCNESHEYRMDYSEEDSHIRELLAAFPESLKEKQHDRTQF